MSNTITVASFDEAVETFNRKYGTLPMLYGGADAPAGLHSRSDVGARSTVDGTPLPTLWDEFNSRLAVFNRQTTAIESRLTATTTLTTERVAIPRRARVEQATELGRPTLIRTERIARGYPLVHYDIGFGFSQEFLDDATTQEIQAINTLATEAWIRRRRQTLNEAVFLKTNYVDKDGIAVKRLYNADGEVPPEYEGYTHDGNHTHYLGYTTAFALDEIQLMETHLLHHGYGDDLNGGAGGTLYLHAPRDLIDDIRGFTGFIPAQSASIGTVINGDIIGGPGGVGIGVQGYLGRFTVIEDLTIPATYLLAYATGGTFSTNNAVRLRQHANPSARGLRLSPGRREYPIEDSFYDAYLGAGIAHRGAVVVMDTGNTTYADPTF